MKKLCFFSRTLAEIRNGYHPNTGQMFHAANKMQTRRYDLTFSL